MEHIYHKLRRCTEKLSGEFVESFHCDLAIFVQCFFLIIGTTPRNPFQLVNPWKWTWNPKIPPWKRRNIYKPPIFGFHVNFSGAYYIFVSRKRCFATRNGWKSKRWNRKDGVGGGSSCWVHPKKRIRNPTSPNQQRCFFPIPIRPLIHTPEKSPLNPSSGILEPHGTVIGFHFQLWQGMDRIQDDGGITWTRAVDGGLLTRVFKTKMAEIFGKNTIWVLPKHWKCLVDSEGERKAP